MALARKDHYWRRANTFYFNAFYGPIYNGKSALLNAADASDNLTLAIINSDAIGPLNYEYAGNAVGSMMANSTITNGVFQKYKDELWQFRSNCYNIYNKNQPPGTPIQKAFSIDYGGMISDPGDNSLDPINVLTATSCNDLRDNLGGNLKSEFHDQLQSYERAMIANTQGGTVAH